eukprot:TRINITY_DN28607_c3_g1_i1.p1 TRINITY_DN28607_c3_g1~~TRINITY_DN28607_c3_g1_i1.p1  ORF type:complete len:363 (-),score=77.69 TRINITY_DN28607_c3_g1_i1:55-1017(-)
MALAAGAFAQLKQDLAADSEGLAEIERQFYSTDVERERIESARKKYPHRRGAKLDAFGQAAEEVVQGRIGGLRVERLVSTTSIKLPVSAFTVFVEFHLAHDDVIYRRSFTGLQTIFDMKKWIYEKLCIPRHAYELSYAEPGKAKITEDTRLLTLRESLDTRTLATTRAVQNMWKGTTTGVHSVDDHGVTRLYMRLKCRTCGDLLNSLQRCQHVKTFGPVTDKSASHAEPCADQELELEPQVCREGLDPTLEECWFQPDPKRNCLFHNRGYEVYEGARGRGGRQAELARIFLSCGQEPSKLLQLNHLPSLARSGAPKTISY